MSVEIQMTVDPATLSANIKSRGRMIMRQATSKGCGVVRNRMVALAPSRYGLLKKSLKIRLRTYKGSTAFVGIIGPKSSFVRIKGVRKRGKLKGVPFRVRPSKYAGLVERGHGGRSPAAAHPFVKPALASSKAAYSQAVQEKVTQLLATELSSKTYRKR